MNDKELLEMAAKAAGISIISYQHGKINCTLDGKKNFHWNPLTEDADAFRLMVQLNMVSKHLFLEFLGEENHSCEGDYYKATRKAVVRAAAEIGRMM